MRLKALFDIEEFTKDWKARMPIKEMAAKYHTSENNVSRRALRVLGLKSRLMPPDSKQAKEILTYYKTHTMPETVEALCVTKSTVQRVAKAAGYCKESNAGVLSKPRKRAEPAEATHQVRVLKQVPSDFVVPDRVW